MAPGRGVRVRGGVGEVFLERLGVFSRDVGVAARRREVRLEGFISSAVASIFAFCAADMARAARSAPPSASSDLTAPASTAATAASRADADAASSIFNAAQRARRVASSVASEDADEDADEDGASAEGLAWWWSGSVGVFAVDAAETSRADALASGEGTVSSSGRAAGESAATGASSSAELELVVLTSRASSAGTSSADALGAARGSADVDIAGRAVGGDPRARLRGCRTARTRFGEWRARFGKRNFSWASQDREFAPDTVIVRVRAEIASTTTSSHSSARAPARRKSRGGSWRGRLRQSAPRATPTSSRVRIVRRRPLTPCRASVRPRLPRALGAFPPTPRPHRGRAPRFTRRPRA